MKLFLWRSFLSGVFVVLPVTIIVIVIARLATTVRVTLHSIVAAPPMSAIFHGHWAVEWALLALLLLCLVTGLVLQLPYMRDLITSADRSLAKHFPSYNVLRGFEAGWMGRGGRKDAQAALVIVDEALAPAFVAEELPDGRYVVFVPSVPSARQGSIYVMTRDRVHLIDASTREVVHCIHYWGMGTGELIKKMRNT